MKLLKHIIKSLWATVTDPQLLSSRPHHGEGSWDCQYCRVTHTIGMTVGDVDSQGNRTCQQCCDDINYQGASEAEKESK